MAALHGVAICYLWCSRVSISYRGNAVPSLLSLLSLPAILSLSTRYPLDAISTDFKTDNTSLRAHCKLYGVVHGMTM